MGELIWLNGETIGMSEARLGVEDRGYQFADGVYEVVRLYNGRPFTLDEHLERLDRSCAGIMLRPPIARTDLAREITGFVPKTGMKEGMVYLQVTRGCCPRNHIFPKDPRPTVLFYTRELPAMAAAGQGEGVKLISVPDERWKRCWIKSIALLPNVLAKNAAVSCGADEGVFVEDGMVSECTASNFFAIAGGKLLTTPVGPKVLPGITRLVLLDIARQLDIPIIERAISEAEALAADEVFITSTTREIGWVERWNDKLVGQGRCGPITLKLHRAFQERVRQQTA
jgi:D-alanine transaminase